jgi:two-component system, NarL family, invasion response regulator UvrY
MHFIVSYPFFLNPTVTERAKLCLGGLWGNTRGNWVMMRIFIADDHAVIREGVKQILADTTDMCVVGEASDMQELLARVAEHPCDVVLLDSTLPRQNGLTPLNALKQMQPQLPVLVFDGQQEHHSIMEAFKSGAAGYLSKDCQPGVLVQAIRRVVQGGRYVNPEVAEYLILAMTAEAERPLHDCLSKRESQVLRLLAAGKRITTIAAELGLQAKTVSTYRSRLLDKMRLQSTADLIQYAIRHGLVE